MDRLLFNNAGLVLDSAAFRRHSDGGFVSWSFGGSELKRAQLNALAFQRAERFIIHIPLLQNREDGLHSESSPRQLPEDARGLLLILRLYQAFLAQKFARLLLVAHALVCHFHG